MAEFPNYLFLQTPDLKESTEPNVFVTTFEDGYEKVGVINSQLKTSYSATYYAENLADYEQFRVWHRNDIKQGTSFFIWKNPKTQIYQKARLGNRGKYTGGNNGEYSQLNGGYMIDLTIEVWE